MEKNSPPPPPAPDEATINAAAPLVDKLFFQILGRVPEPAARQFWAERIAGGQASIGEVAVGIFESDERLDPAIRRIYREYLRRSVDPEGLKHWRDEVWKRDGGPDAIIVGILASDEYFAAAGGETEAWLLDISNRLLGRPPEAAELQAWKQALDSGERKRSQAVLELLRNETNLRRLIQSWFRLYFVRVPSAEEESHYLERLRAGDTHRLVQIRMLDSKEWREAPGPAAIMPLPTDGAATFTPPAPLRLPMPPMPTQPSAGPSPPSPTIAPAAPIPRPATGPTPMPPAPSPPATAQPPAARKPTPQNTYDLIFEELGRDQGFE